EKSSRTDANRGGDWLQRARRAPGRRGTGHYSEVVGCPRLNDHARSGNLWNCCSSTPHALSERLLRVEASSDIQNASTPVSPPFFRNPLALTPTIEADNEGRRRLS